MLRSNTKRAKENIKQYIIDKYNFVDFPCKENFKEVAKNIYNNFVECLMTNPRQRANNLKYYGTETDVFVYYCGGLPDILDTCYYYNRSAIDDLGSILEESEEEKDNYTEQQAQQWLTYLIYREIKGAIK